MDAAPLRPLVAEHEGSSAGVRGAAASGAPRRRRLFTRRLWFWVRRYLPPELAGTATMLAAGLAVALSGVHPVVVGVVATVAESIGFYAVVAIAVWREQRMRAPDRSRIRTAGRTLALLGLEFGPAEILDSALVRPALLVAALALLPHTVWALVVGKLAADVVFYVLAATAFRVTERTGIRDAPRGDASED